MTFFSNIWRNEKSREIIVQIIVLFFLGWFISWLVMNVNANFEALGKDISFEFLFIPAGYDINQYLIDYDSRDSHLRAGIVGLLNTGLVAFFWDYFSYRVRYCSWNHKIIKKLVS
jgi:general L-amino acid transport system permease protein